MNPKSKLTKLFAEKLNIPITELETKHLNLIKYSNNKLYNKVTSKYITLYEIFNYIKKGYSLKVIDNKTKNDITTLILVKSLVYDNNLKNNEVLNLIRRENYV